MKTRNFALLAAFSTAIIYGVSYTVAKDVMPVFVKPFALIFFRVLGAAVLFWVSSLFVKKETIDRKDYPRLFLGALLGTSLNMLFFYKGLQDTTPIVASAIGVATPLMVFVFSLILLKERLIASRIVGLSIGLIGAFVLITYKHDLSNNESSILGNFYVFINASFYGLYLVLMKKILQKYHPVNVVKWMYLVGVFIVLPFSYSELCEIEWKEMPQHIYFELFYIVVFATFLNFLFNLFALSKLKPTTVSVFVYLHPVFASIYALIVGSDSLSFVKIITTLLVCVGVYLVTKPAVKSSKGLRE